MFPPSVKKRLQIALLCLLVLALASFASRPAIVKGSPSALLEGAQVPPAVFATVDRACRDCHSEATRYPWYSYVAPVSFLIGHDVTDGRRHLNLSRWKELPLVRRQRSLSDIANQVTSREMPLSFYTMLHTDAKLSQADINRIF